MIGAPWNGNEGTSEMLICPQCKFENPNSNKFCQNCGTSLTQKICPECGTGVAINAKQCHNCGAECGMVWLATIVKTPTEQITVSTRESSGDSLKETETTNSNEPISSEQVVSRPLEVGYHLDSQRRYQLLENLPTWEEVEAKSEICVKVLDSQPYQISPLTAVLENISTNTNNAVLESDRIPDIAKVYIALYPQVHYGIPLIHDAWQQGDMQVILLEDRSNWKQLLDLWSADTTTSFQILHFCHQMTVLWQILEPFNCCRSLLQLSNLKLDEDQAVALQKLYFETVSEHVNNVGVSYSVIKRTNMPVQNSPLKVQALGRVWQALFRQSQRTQVGAFVELLGDLEFGKIQTLKQLQLRLEDIGTQLQCSNNIASPTLLQVNDDIEEGEKMNEDSPTVTLPLHLISLEDAGVTDVGSQRDHNEDYFGIETKISKLELPRSGNVGARGLYILCDGMGGHAGGEVASKLAVDTLREYFQTHWTDTLPSKETILEAVSSANQAIYDVNQQEARSGIGRMGTTLVMLLIQDTHVAAVHVGDSRLYRLTRKRGFEQITVDHEVGQREIIRGVEPSIAYSRPDAYQLTQALGPRDDSFISPEVQFFEIDEDSLFILVSDGLSDNNLLENHWQDSLQPLLKSDANLHSGLRELIELANKYNGHDNITAVLIRSKVGTNVRC